ncbi:hypothetical protein PYW07_004831 [Mythimna separata]|uniref:Caspase family p20 domain-containing protein n=1 Tax=Mythimna separata TaxID=271217 RepID=A0AAD8DZC3_MYTSE|nr:hypothetical protein PYW07_004831 [Mythimna separata]
MGPNPKVEEIEVNFTIEDRANFVVCAMPFNKASYQKAEENKKDSEVSEPEDGGVRVVPSVNEVLEEVDPLRVSTMARYSYELDRYTKNAMLIFEGNASDIAFENSDEDAPPKAEDMSMKFKETFEKFRFEVHIHRNLTDEEIASTCERFFQRDFSEYGCVAVMMLAKIRDGIVESSHTPNSEHGVLRYMSDLAPPTLQDKPKIFIVQTEDYYVIPRARVWSTLPQDNLEFRLAVPIVSSPDPLGRRTKVYCLLEHIYKKINRLGDQTDLQTIFTDSINEYVRTSEFCVVPGYYSTLTKELRLFRTPEP